MLGPFRIRRTPGYQVLRPKTSQLATSQGESFSNDGDAVATIQGAEYDSLISAHPNAKLRYIDEEHEVITVGSQAELAQRLHDPVPAFARSRPPLALPFPTPAHMHVFDFKPGGRNAELWWEIEKKTLSVMTGLHKEEREAVAGTGKRRTIDTETEALDRGVQSAEHEQDPPKARSENLPEDGVGLPGQQEENVELRKELARLRSQVESLAQQVTGQDADVLKRHFESTNPPKLYSDLRGVFATDSNEPNGQTSGLPKTQESVLTETGKRQAMELGQQLKRVLTTESSQGLPKISRKDAADRWASYSTALQTYPTSIELVSKAKNGVLPKEFYEGLRRSLSTGMGQDQNLEKDVTSDNGGQQATPDVQANTTTIVGQTKSTDDKSTADLVAQTVPTYTTSEAPGVFQTQASRYERSPRLSVTNPEEIKPLLSQDAKEDTPESVEGQSQTGTFLQGCSEQEILDELGRRNIPLPIQTHKDLKTQVKEVAEMTAEKLAEKEAQHLKELRFMLKDVLPKENVKSSEEKKSTLSEPVEVSVGKMMMQMVSSVISNMETLNSQIKYQASSQLVEEPLRLRGYPGSTGHGDDLWQDIEHLKDTFAEFDKATSDILRSFKRMHDHDEFPSDSGMFRLNGFSNSRGPLPQIATALQDLAQGLTKTCIPAIGESNGRLQYHIPRRLATSGYSDTWELHIEPVPRWATEESFIKDFVERSMLEHDIEVTVSTVNIDVLNPGQPGAFFEIVGLESAESVLRKLQNTLLCGNHVNLTMKRKLYPTVFGTKAVPSTGSLDNTDTASDNVSEQSNRSSIKAKAEMSEKRKAIQDRRSAWRREYKARTQNHVRFEEPTDKHETDADSSFDRKAIEEHIDETRTSQAHNAPTEQTPSTAHSTNSATEKPILTWAEVGSGPSKQPKGVEKRQSMPNLQPTSVSNPFIDPIEGNPEDQMKKFKLARRVSEEFRAKQGLDGQSNDFRAVTSTFIPYGDRDPAGYIPFKLEAKPAATAKPAKPLSGAGHVPARSSSPPAYYSPPSFPPLPSMEPLVPTRVGPFWENQEAPVNDGFSFGPAAAKNQSSNSSSDALSASPSGYGNTSKVLFVGKIPMIDNQPNEKAVEKMFHGIGPIVSIKYGRTKSTLGSCLIEFASISAAVYAQDEMNGFTSPNQKSPLLVTFHSVTSNDDFPTTGHESSGSFSCRMMGVDPPEDTDFPIASPDLKPSEPSTTLRKTQSLEPLLNVRPISSALDFQPASTNTLSRRHTTIDRDSKTPSGPWGRRPYSENFDGTGRKGHHRRRRSQDQSAPQTSTANSQPKPNTQQKPAPQPKLASQAKPASQPTLYSSFHVPGSWHTNQQQIPVTRRPSVPAPVPAPTSAPEPKPSAPEPKYQSLTQVDTKAEDLIEDCVSNLKILGYGSPEDAGDERLLIVAQAADGNLGTAIDVIEEQGVAWSQRA